MILERSPPQAPQTQRSMTEGGCGDDRRRGYFEKGNLKQASSLSAPLSVPCLLPEIGSGSPSPQSPVT